MTPIFVNHYPPSTDRKNYLKSVLTKVNWVTEPTKENLTETVKEEWYLDCENTWIEKCSFFNNKSEYRKLTNGDIACSLGHINSWKLFLKTKQKYGLFLEDDVIINCEDVEEKILNITESAPEDADVIFVGGGFNHYEVSRTLKVINKNYHLKMPPNTNCAISYILKTSAAKKIINHCKPFTMPIDFELNYIFKKLDLKVYHYIPYLMSEGSKTGEYSSIQR